MLGSNLGRKPECWPEVFRGAPESLEANARLVSPVGRDRFVLNLFIIRLSTYHLTLYAVDTNSVVKYRRIKTEPWLIAFFKH
jgi:hypothetical protein